MNRSFASKIPTTATQPVIFDFENFSRFQQSKTNDSISNEIVSNIIGNDKFESYLKDLIEGIVFNQWTKYITSATATLDDPFDAIYIADLKPDYIHNKYYNTLNSYALNIIDKSNEISINDGWDD